MIKANEVYETITDLEDWMSTDIELLKPLPIFVKRVYTEERNFGGLHSTTYKQEVAVVTIPCFPLETHVDFEWRSSNESDKLVSYIPVEELEVILINFIETAIFLAGLDWNYVKQDRRLVKLKRLFDEYLDLGKLEGFAWKRRNLTKYYVKER